MGYNVFGGSYPIVESRLLDERSSGSHIFGATVLLHLRRNGDAVGVGWGTLKPFHYRV